MSNVNENRTKCEVWTRAMGYCRPIQNFNKSKKYEYESRKFFTEKKTVERLSDVGLTVEEKVAA